jgi:RNA polymerase sigma factor (sigma-70 family)
MEEATKTVEKQTPVGTSSDNSWDVFLSYAVEDIEWVKAVEAKLKSLHLRTFDPYAIPTEFWGQNREEVAVQVFPTRCQVAFIVLSCAYLASEQSNRELATIVEASQIGTQPLLLPARLDDSVIPEPIRTLTALDVGSVTPDAVAENIATRIREWKKNASQTRKHMNESNEHWSNSGHLSALVRTIARREALRLRPAISVVDSEEIEAEVLRRAFPLIEKHSVGDSLQLLNCLVHSVAIEHLRRRRWFQTKERPLFDQDFAQVREVDPIDTAIEHEDIARVRGAIDQLSEQDRQIIEWRYLEELPFMEMAKNLNVSEASVRIRLRRALTLLRHLLDVES